MKALLIISCKLVKDNGWLKKQIGSCLNKFDIIKVKNAEHTVQDYSI